MIHKSSVHNRKYMLYAFMNSGAMVSIIIAMLEKALIIGGLTICA